jgi:hypothetical protein
MGGMVFLYIFFFLNKQFGEQITILHVHVGHVQHRPQGVKLIQAYRSQETSSWLLLTSSYLLDSLIPEVYCMNQLVWFEYAPKSYSEATVMQVYDILHTKDL